MKTILITGGAGSVGREVAICLASRGHRVRAYDLPGCDVGPLEQIPLIEMVTGDIRDQDEILRAVSGVDVVIHLAALLPPASEQDRETTIAINVGGTANIIAALKQKCPNARLIFSSSVCVYGDTSATRPPVRVSHPVRALDLYAQSKIEAERLVIGSRIPYTILRISGISVPAFLEPPPTWPFKADQRLEFICRTDVATALAACAETEAASAKILNIAGGSMWQMLGREYVTGFNQVMGLSAEDTRYSQGPECFDWYDTDESQAVLSYQQTPFAQFLDLLQAAIDDALGTCG